MKIRFAIIAMLTSIILPVFTYAQAGPPPTVNVTDTCTVVDTVGTSHTYNQPGQFLGICGLAAAKDQGAVSTYTLQNFSFGLYLQSLGGTTPSATQFWDLYSNGVEASVGLSDLSIATGDTLKFQLTDFTDNSQVGSPIVFQIGTLTATPTPAPASSAARGGGVTLHAPFDVPLALSFLSEAQHADGSFDSLLLSDWAAIAFAGGGAGDAQKRLAKYFIENPPLLQSVSDYERHAMALEALGINPYATSTLAGTTSNPIAQIVNAFDGTQIGDVSLVNDDIFALFPLLHAGYNANDAIIRKSTDFIISKQDDDGSWENSTDMTAAAIQALSLVRQIPDAQSAITRAAAYLNGQEKKNGGFGNSYSTSWVLQAINSLEDSHLNWASDYHTPQYYLATLQQSDGGIEPLAKDAQTRVWATAYAFPAIEGKTWDALLSSFDKPAAHQDVAPIATTTSATTTLITVAMPEASSTPSLPEETTTKNVPPSETVEPPTVAPIAPATTTSTESPYQLSQVAAAGSVPVGFFTGFWDSIISFFGHLF